MHVFPVSVSTNSDRNCSNGWVSDGVAVGKSAIQVYAGLNVH